MDREIKKLQSELDSLLEKIDVVKDTNDDIDNMERNINEINRNYEDLEERIARLKEMKDDEETDGQKPLIDKLNIITKDMDNIKKKLDEKTNKLDKLKRKNKYFEGELTGTEKKKAEREIVLDNCKEVDNQGLIINDIHLNIQQTGDHLVDINNELNDQGEIIDRVHGKVLDTKEKIGKTGKVMSKIEFRNQCMKVVTLIAVIVIGIFDFVWVGYLIYRRYG